MTNSAFRRHGIEWLSPSSLNLWADQPGLWTLRYLAGVREETGPAMARGKAVEDGMLQCLHGKPGAVQAALSTFEQNVAGEISDEIEAEQLLIAPMLAQCMLWNPPGQLLASQIKVEHFFDGVSVPVIGYLDFSFEPTDVDLKTTKKCPSAPRPEHVRQVALYRAARAKAGGLLYVTDKRQAYFDINDDARDVALGELHSAALTLERFLSRFESGEDAIRCLPMNRDSFRFSKQHELKLAELRL